MIFGRPRAGWRNDDGAYPVPVADMIRHGRWACVRALVTWGVPIALLVLACSQGRPS